MECWLLLHLAYLYIFSNEYIYFSKDHIKRGKLVMRVWNEKIGILKVEYGWIHLVVVHLRTRKYFTDNSSANFHDKFFLHFLLNFSKNEEKTCRHGNLLMSRL